MFCSVCFVPYVLFSVFSSACFVLCVLFQSGHPPPPSPPAFPMERCQPTPLSAAGAAPALWDSRKVVWSGSRSLTVARSVWVVTAARPYRWRHKPWRWVTMTSSSAVTWTGWWTSQENTSGPALDVSDLECDEKTKTKKRLVIFCSHRARLELWSSSSWQHPWKCVKSVFDCLIKEMRWKHLSR